MIQDNSKDEVVIIKGYYKSGALRYETPFVYGTKKHGAEKGYYESGALGWETPYVNGHVHGIAKNYYESGALKWEAPYVDGKMHGIEKSYNKDKANIECLSLYKKGQRVISMRIWSESNLYENLIYKDINHDAG